MNPGRLILSSNKILVTRLAAVQVTANIAGCFVIATVDGSVFDGSHLTLVFPAEISVFSHRIQFAA